MNLELAIAILLKNTFCILLLSCIFSTFISCSQKHSDTTVVGSMTLFLFHVAKYYWGYCCRYVKILRYEGHQYSRLIGQKLFESLG